MLTFILGLAIGGGIDYVIGAKKQGSVVQTVRDEIARIEAKFQKKP